MPDTAAEDTTMAPLVLTELGLRGFCTMPRVSSGRAQRQWSPRATAPPLRLCPCAPPLHPHPTHMTALPPGFSCSTPLPSECTPP